MVHPVASVRFVGASLGADVLEKSVVQEERMHHVHHPTTNNNQQQSTTINQQQSINNNQSTTTSPSFPQKTAIETPGSLSQMPKRSIRDSETRKDEKNPRLCARRCSMSPRTIKIGMAGVFLEGTDGKSGEWATRGTSGDSTVGFTPLSALK
jgi:hypothetical protein